MKENVYQRRALSALLLAFLLAPACSVAAGSTVTPGPVAVVEPPKDPAAPPVFLPNKKGSLKFAVIGDFGTGEPAEFELAQQVVKFYQEFKYDVVILVGDNLYGAERPQDFKLKFEDPYKPLLDAGVKFYGCLGNHDAREQRFYKLFNMDGKFYYSFKAPNEKVRFFALDTTYPVPEQIAWIEKDLMDSSDHWKIPFFHHPLYSSGYRHGSDVKLRETLEPLFVKYGVSVAFSGHDHFYERIKPQNGIVYFVAGSGGQLRAGNIDKGSTLTAKGFDTDQAFMVVEITGDQMYFNAISRHGETVDSGIVERRKPG